ncbi:sigma-54-dependent transcriptional regulator [Reinekea marinisedimentorum]|uniref:Two-component system response regulator PilR (NtrC family) n=1 Tax=Reinekea marinisedimentorum TaxID=230495 RepID=A0A4R3HWE1_9GAMM|nr:sigma-54 dependent transcriptional regulator [Reinekea marinisedimentorum]TCS36435.1 two-component system response regulator PilR (NtrC family) [Reinekea marinisedimentorum]
MSNAQKVLIIDDEPDIRELLEITLMRMGVESFSAYDVQSALKSLNKNDVDLILTDMRLPDGDGLQIVRHVAEKKPDTPIAVITAHGSMDLAIESLKAGAFDFVSKPIDIHKLRDLINQALKVKQESTQPEASESEQSKPLILGKSEPMIMLEKKIRKLAVSQAPVFIHGESGTGKELVARQIHKLGPRRSFPFVPVNCGAIPSELMESEFFGHKKGSFTGASEDKQGFFQAADGGTLFLDEVADLPLAMQVKLLRAIQEKKVRPIGSQHEINVDVRILSATHKNLENLVEEGLFRQDLFYRINVISLLIPPLRNRNSDIPLLCGRILSRIADTYQLPAAKLDAKAKKALDLYAFPGNVRELENILERAFAMCEEDTITEEDLNLNESSSSSISPLPSTNISSRPEGVSLEDYLMDIERNVVEQALEETRWNRTAAAKKLGITFRALRYRLKKLGLD